ncbi:MAG: GntR family transcriptional regulator [Chloroflexi bacterium]|nr:GntR family transcriptional regulator [Chloroflexota bacterium]
MVTSYRTMQEIVHDTIRESILNGHYPPGHRLIADDLAKELGVSRMPIREALHRLEVAGLVMMLPHRGAVVSEFSEPDIIEVYHIRAVLDGLAARLATPNLIDADFKQLDMRLKEMEKKINDGDNEGFLQANREFHTIVWKAAHAPRLQELLENLYDTSQPFRNTSLQLPGRAEQILEEHRQIADALKQRDAVAAEKYANVHHESTATRLLHALENKNSG